MAIVFFNSVMIIRFQVNIKRMGDIHELKKLIKESKTELGEKIDSLVKKLEEKDIT